MAERLLPPIFREEQTLNLKNLNITNVHGWRLTDCQMVFRKTKIESWGQQSKEAQAAVSGNEA